MIRWMHRLSAPASESHLALALCMAALAMSLMLWAIIWESSIITYQREIIHWLWIARASG
jgi:hypothetical protein